VSYITWEVQYKAILGAHDQDYHGRKSLPTQANILENLL